MSDSGKSGRSASVVSRYLFRLPTTRKDKTPKVIAKKSGQLQADVMYLVSYGAWTGGYKYCLNVVDVWSRYAWSYPMKKLTKNEAKKHLLESIEELQTKFGVPKEDISVTTDQGVEFSSQYGTFNPVDNDESDDFDIGSITLPVTHVVINPGMGKGRTVLVERFNRTLHELLRIKRLEEPNNRGGDVFLKYVEECVQFYNVEKVHSTIDTTPYDALTGVTLPVEVVQNEVATFKPDDAVLVVRKLGQFDKASSSVRWDPKLWKVTGQIGWRYTLVPYQNTDGEEFEDEFGYNPLGSELQLVRPNDIESYLAYEKPKRVVEQIDEETSGRKRQRKAQQASKQIEFMSKTQKMHATPSTEHRKKRVDYAAFNR